jgi:hypothetical protein
MDARAAIAAIGVVVNPLDVVDEFRVGGGSRALRAHPPSIIASRRDAEHVAHVTRPSWTIRTPDRSSGTSSPRFSRQSRNRAFSSLPMMIRASEPPMKWRRSRFN